MDAKESLAEEKFNIIKDKVLARSTLNVQTNIEVVLNMNFIKRNKQEQLMDMRSLRREEREKINKIRQFEAKKRRDILNEAEYK